jgi:hypothetical protein
VSWLHSSDEPIIKICSEKRVEFEIGQKI